MARRGRKPAPTGLPPAQDAIVQAALARVKKARNRQNNEISAGYIADYRKFIVWVMKENRQPYPDDLPYRFISRENIDAYYMEVVPKKELKSTPQMKRMRYALNAMWSLVETKHLPDDPEGSFPVLRAGENVREFAVKNDVVIEGEQKQAAFYATIAKLKNGGTDPFKGLKLDLLTKNDKRVLLSYIMKERPDWKDLGCSFNLGCNAGLRGKSTRSLCLKDLYISHGFAPDEGKSLTIVLRKEVQKVSYQVDRLVGCMRHRDYLLCGVFCTAMNVISLLKSEGSNIHFKGDPDPKKDAEWWSKDFVSFVTLEDEKNAMLEVSTDQLSFLYLILI